MWPNMLTRLGKSGEWKCIAYLIFGPNLEKTGDRKRHNGKYEPPHDKTNKMACAPNEDSDQSGHPSSLIRVFAVRMKKHFTY